MYHINRLIFMYTTQHILLKKKIILNGTTTKIIKQYKCEVKFKRVQSNICNKQWVKKIYRKGNK